MSTLITEMNLPSQHEPEHLVRRLSINSTSALDHFSDFEELLQTKHLVLLLDYDGTLTPIVNDPSKALITEEVRDTLRVLPNHFVTGIVTGRSLAKIRNFVGVPGLFYAGSHGFDILAPNINTIGLGDERGVSVRASSTASVEHERINSNADLIDCEENTSDSIDEFGVRYQVAGEFLPTLQKIRVEVEKAVSTIPGAEVEDNIYSISVHYRNCPREELPKIKDIVTSTKESHNGIRLSNGKEVYELQPDVQWNKGCAVVWMLDMLGLSSTKCIDSLIEQDNVDKEIADKNSNGNRDINSVGNRDDVITLPTADPMHLHTDHSIVGASEVFTIFIGDDKTDEDAFKVFRAENGTQPQQSGFGILVSEVNRPTSAIYTLRNPNEVYELLNRLLKVGRARNLRPAHQSRKTALNSFSKPIGQHRPVSADNPISTGA